MLIMSASQRDTTNTLSPDAEAKSLGDCYGLLLADIRRNRARRLAKQGESETNKTNCDLYTTDNRTSPTSALRIEHDGPEVA